MAATFDKARPVIVAAEGGTVDSASDYGGFTKLGISHSAYPHLNIAALTTEQCFTILKEDYWDHYHLDQIDNQIIANQCLLLFINMNPLNAGRIIQAAIKGCGQNIVIDGVCGSSTYRSLNSAPQGWLSDRLRTEACRYYLQRTDEDHTQIPNIRGWIRRALL